MWLHAPNIDCVHGFSTRHGGVSPAPFSTLNLGGSEDKEENVQENRRRALKALNLSFDKLLTLRQLHSAIVCEAGINRQEGDAIVTNRPGDVLGVMVADCYPVLFFDRKNRVIGAAHCGWRGTVAGLAAKTVDKMLELGAEKNHIYAAIGQGISQNNFEVGYEVIDKFREAGFPESCWNNRRIDLIACLKYNLATASLPEENVWSMNRCTFEPDFFSHRRDNGKTGRMMGIIALE